MGQSGASIRRNGSTRQVSSVAWRRRASACVGATFAALCFLVSLLLLLLLLLLLDMVFKALPAKTRFVFSVLRKPADRQT